MMWVRKSSRKFSVISIQICLIFIKLTMENREFSSSNRIDIVWWPVLACETEEKCVDSFPFVTGKIIENSHFFPLSILKDTHTHALISLFVDDFDFENNFVFIFEKVDFLN